MRTLVFTLLLLMAAGCKESDDEAPEAAVSVTAAHPIQGPISQQISADAILAPLSQAALAPRISAAIHAEYVQRGDHVRKGQLLVTLEDHDLQGSALDSKGTLLAARANLTATQNATVPEDRKKAELDVAQLQAARDVAARTAQERDRLYQQGALSGRDADTAKSAAVQAQVSLDLAKQHLQSVLNTTGTTTTQTAQGQLQSANGRYLSARAQIAYANLRSPIDGVVTDRPLFPGETASAGTPVVTVMDVSSLLAKLHLAQATSQQLRLGQRAQVQMSGEDDPVDATVSFISPVLDPGSTTVEVWLKLPNPAGRFKAGTPVHVTIRGNTVQQALLLPPAAILPAPDGTTAVLVVGPDNVAHKRTVTVGTRTPEQVEITSGLAPADNVIVEGSYGLDDGTRVKSTKTGSGKDAKSSPAAEDKD